VFKLLLVDVLGRVLHLHLLLLLLLVVGQVRAAGSLVVDGRGGLAAHIQVAQLQRATLAVVAAAAASLVVEPSFALAERACQLPGRKLASLARLPLVAGILR